MLNAPGILQVVLVSAIVHGTLEATVAPFQSIYNQDESLRSIKSSKMLRSMNLDADPCDDFYEYACGNYEKHARVKATSDGARTESLTDSKMTTELHELLAEQVTVEEDTSVRKVKEFYTSCIGAQHNGLAQQAFFSEFIKDNGGFPAVPGSNWQVHHHNYNWQQVVGQLRYRYNMNILIGMVVDINHLNFDENSIYLGEPNTLIPRPELCSVEGTKRIDIREKSYEILEKEVAERLTQWLTLKSHVAKQLAADIVTFEFDLCTTMQEDAYGLDAVSRHINYTRKTLIDFTHQFDNLIDFDQFVSSSFNQPFYKPVFMRATSEKYFAKLIKTIESNSIATVANYIMYRALSLLAFPLDDSRRKRPKYCVQLIKRSFPKILGEMYYRKHGNSNAKADVEEMYDKIKQSFEDSLQSSWIKESTSRIGKQKLKNINLVFPRYDKVQLNHLQIERSNYWHNLGKVLAQVQHREIDRLYENEPKPRFQIESYDQHIQYQPLLQQLIVAWGALQSPLYQSFYPYAMKYALIGVKLARELSFGFDEIGWSFDRFNNWDGLTAQEYRNRTECFRQQISNYMYNNPTQYRNDSQLRELIATSNGVNVTFNAYITWLSYMSPNNDHAALVRETLPEINLTNTQLFFVTFAQMHCLHKQNSRRRVPNFGPMQLHTPERYAVNGLLGNCPEFAREFNCIPGSEMHPIDKCVIY